MDGQDLQVKTDPMRPHARTAYGRSRIRRIHSLDLIPEHPTQEDAGDYPLVTQPTNLATPKRVNSVKVGHSVEQSSQSLSQHTLGTKLRNAILFWPSILTHILWTTIRYILYLPLSVAAPSFWLSALLWIFWKLIRIPISCIKCLLPNEVNTPRNASTLPAEKRTILISSGSSIQALHLARNLYSSGARVIVFEYDGYFGLCRFSTAVDKFYVVPRPTRHNVDNYIAALCHIVQREKPSVYIPVCATSSAYYDSLAKPHLELMGCASFVPGLQETIILDDCQQLYEKCAAQNIPLPPHATLTSHNDLWHLYETGFISNFRNTLLAVGMQGILERYKYILPNNRQDFKFNHDIDERQQWLVIRDLPGQEHFITCTTVKDSRVVANVSCRVDRQTRNLIPIVHPRSTKANPTTSDAHEIDQWLRTFFTKVRFQKPINGHISFRLAKCPQTGQFLPLNVRIGVSLPYIVYNRSHAQILYRTMKCINMNPLSLFSSEQDSSWRWPSMQTADDMAALDKREALFTYWDPLPYCAYYHFQLPMKSVKLFLQKRNKKHHTKNNLARLTTAPVH